MKNIMKKLILSLVLLLLPKFVLGYTFTTNVSTAKVDVGSSTTFKITGSKIVGRFDIKTNDASICKISLSTPASSKYSGVVTADTQYKDWFQEQEGETQTSTIKVTGVSAGTCTITVIPSDMTDFDTDATVSGNKTVSVTVNAAKSSVNTLSDLKVNGETITGFSADKTSYTYATTISKDVSEITIEATATDSKATLVGIGKQNLSYGKNTLNVIVTAENGTKKNYSIVVNREDPRDTDNTLKSCTLTGVDGLNFSSSTTTYSLTGTNGTSVSIQCTPNSSNASFKANYGNRTVTLKEGTNKIEVIVVAENQTTKTYTFNIVVPEGNKSTDATLSTLNITDVMGFSFNPNTYEYNVTVYNTVSSVTVTSALNDSKASFVKSYDYSNKTVELKNDTTEIIIKTQAETTSVTAEYKITITKVEEPIVKSIEVTGTNVNFDSETKSYNVKVEKNTKLEFNFNLKDGYTTEIKGNENLENGSVITIEIKLGDEVVDTYTYNVEMEEEEEVQTKVVEDNFFNSDAFKYICIAVLILGIILFILSFMYYKKALKNKEEVI